MSIPIKSLDEIMDELKEKAMCWIEKQYPDRTGKRKWLWSNDLDSYSDPQYRVKVIVWEGSVNKGIVLLDYGNLVALAISHRWVKTRRFHADIGVEM